ncbi:uncharacterized protein Tco025E_04169 [Trypanosoma conorhini]|uniref:Uncharacterized protein n=1 Tax=Trypanosoma conorhini TaxID=83891 RepID=A0A422PNR3_9TRYP|nr:uncharacterized protein Tco025E_04169 [Trypanosoma conorhini]RNF19358.1 hypothetical protein Tco025E_04169 [Trypanosoma conorhini]
MRVAAQRFDQSAYGGQRVAGDGVAPLGCCCGGCAAERPPCCCESFRESAEASGVPPQRGATQPRQQQLRRHHQQQNEGGEEQLQERQRSSSRHCFCCVPEQEELQEYERMEKERRYRSMRAERQQLQAALHDDVWRGATPRYEPSLEHSYRSNTAQLLRYSQGSFYQRAVAMERERRRRELRKEIEERKREMSARGPKRQPMAVFTSLGGVKRTVAPAQRMRGPDVAGCPVCVCPTTGLMQHPHPGSGVRTAATRSAALLAPRGGSRGRSCPYLRARKSHKGTDPHVSGGTPLALTGMGMDMGKGKEAASVPSAPHSLPCRRVKEGREAPSPSLPLRGGKPECRCRPCKCCQCPESECRCKPCRCCRCADGAGSAEVTPTIPHTADTVPAAKVEEKGQEAPAVPLRATSAPPRLSRLQRSATDHGRKIYITDDAYLSRRSKVIELLERDGYVRRLSPTTRSPSAPLPEKTRKWATTRSTSAHRVCV